MKQVFNANQLQNIDDRNIKERDNSRVKQRATPDLRRGAHQRSSRASLG